MYRKMLYAGKTAYLRMMVYECATNYSPGSFEKLRQALMDEQGNKREIINERRDTPLHLLATYGADEALKKLIDEHALLTKADLRKSNLKGDTPPLHEAARFGHTKVVETILKFGVDLAEVTNHDGETPLYLAAANGKKDTFDYLLHHTGSAAILTKRNDSKNVLHAAVMGEYFGIPAFYIVQGDQGDVTRVNRWRLTKKVIDFAWFKEIDDVKQKDILALALSKKLIRLKQDGKTKVNVQEPIIYATKNHIDELVTEILRIQPEAEFVYDEEGKNLLHIAVASRNMFVFKELMKRRIDKGQWMAEVDNKGNTLMHFAANVGYIKTFPLGAMSQMTWDVFWFKTVKHNTPPHLTHIKNKNDKTAIELFEENHKSLLESAERSAKEVCQGIMVVAAIIGAIDVAALFTIPGGFDDKNGRPILLDTHGKELRWFMDYVLNNLCSSLLSLGALLSILLSRFHANDFHFVLPMKFIIAFTSLFYAACFSLTTCLQAIVLEDKMNYVYLPFLYIGIALTGLGFIDMVYLLFNYTIGVIYRSLSYTSSKEDV